MKIHARIARTPCCKQILHVLPLRHATGFTYRRFRQGASSMTTRSRRTSAPVSPETAAATSALKKYNAALKSVRAAIEKCEDASGDLLAIYSEILPRTRGDEYRQISEGRLSDKRHADAIVATLKQAIRQIQGMEATAIGVYGDGD